MAEMGRPTLYSEEIVSLLAAAFQRGASISTACVYAGITRDTFYAWVKRYPDFSDKIGRAKIFLIMDSAEGIFNAIHTDKDLATMKWYLEKKDPDFKNKVELEDNTTSSRNDELHEMLELMKKEAKDARGATDADSPTTEETGPDDSSE